MWVLMCLPHHHTHHDTLESLRVAKWSTQWAVLLSSLRMLGGRPLSGSSVAAQKSTLGLPCLSPEPSSSSRVAAVPPTGVGQGRVLGAVTAAGNFPGKLPVELRGEPPERAYCGKFNFCLLPRAVLNQTLQR